MLEIGNRIRHCHFFCRQVQSQKRNCKKECWFILIPAHTAWTTRPVPCNGQSVYCTRHFPDLQSSSTRLYDETRGVNLNPYDSGDLRICRFVCWRACCKGCEIWRVSNSHCLHQPH